MLSPCQVSDHPPDWHRKAVGAGADHQDTLAARCSGSTPPSFFSSTSDLRTASRASARTSGELITGASGCGPVAGDASNRPDAHLDAEDPRNGIVDPAHRDAARASHRRRSLAMNCFQSSGTMIRSMPALIACGQCHLVQPGTCSIAVPVADHQAVEAEPLLQHVVDEMRVAVHLAPCAARSRCR